jgi:hypothetical protein
MTEGTERPTHPYLLARSDLDGAAIRKHGSLICPRTGDGGRRGYGDVSIRREQPPRAVRRMYYTRIMDAGAIARAWFGIGP